jgi:Fe-S-cluster-containing dehydrogenase component
MFAPTLGGLVLLTGGAASAESPAGANADAVPTFLIDVSRCQGCGNCQRACSAANSLSCDPPQTELNSETYTVIGKVPGQRDRNAVR